MWVIEVFDVFESLLDVYAFEDEVEARIFYDTLYEKRWEGEARLYSPEALELFEYEFFGDLSTDGEVAFNKFWDEYEYAN